MIPSTEALNMPSDPPKSVVPVVAVGSDDSSHSPAVDYASIAVAAMSEGVVVQLASGEIISCNQAAERILTIGTLIHDRNFDFRRRRG
jgi:PAS domain-containing protein